MGWVEHGVGVNINNSKRAVNLGISWKEEVGVVGVLLPDEVLLNFGMVSAMGMSAGDERNLPVVCFRVETLVRGSFRGAEELELKKRYRPNTRLF